MTDRTQRVAGGSPGDRAGGGGTGPAGSTGSGAGRAGTGGDGDTDGSTDRDRIRTFPFPAELAVGGVGMQMGPMGTDRTWHADAPLHRVHRIDFHVVMLFTDGPVRHMIDFAEYEADAGDVLWIRPGQVHRFSRDSLYRGTVLTMQPGFLPRSTVEATGLYRYDLPPLLHPAPAQLDALRTALDQLHREYEDTATLPLSLHTAVLRHTLTAVLLRLAHLAASAAPASRQQTDSTFTRFRDAVEEGFATNHSVSAYADDLGYSRRTLVRAVRAATGETPKGFIDKRVVLEAKRLLAHTDLPIGRVGAAVGFPDAANFSKFFHLHTGHTPVAFRAELR
ncbi:helix-turn-helix domain-containing protein [Streptomyces sp. SID486]|uniref:helix-turn-helix domain-containing protein n=1 Tax=unclassified Streptomyces TaxID=2593676 RepID=UPI00137172AE|nr:MULTISPECIES: AraC family transcriptional regulator [unclassified Streptomyces]MYX97901.1 helix-turn-helix domain-containing protein [Streptomyces sp. SID486]